MPTKRSRTTKVTPPPTSTPTETTTATTTSTRPVLEESLDIWSQFARQTGETISDFARRFGEEQQKNYERWLGAIKESTRPLPTPPQTEAVEARFQEWNRVAREIGERLTEALMTTFRPPNELVEAWAKALSPPGADAATVTRSANDLIQKFWTGLVTELPRRSLEALRPGTSAQEFFQAQEAQLKDITETFSKLSQTYLTSPAFVTLFGRTLDASLDLQRSLSQETDVLSRITGLPSRREITELNQAIKDLSAKVEKLDRRGSS